MRILALMKRVVPCIALLCVLIAANAFAIWDPSGNNVTEQAVRRFDERPRLVADGSGAVYVAWNTSSDWGPYDQDVAVCRVSSAGDVLWSAFPGTQAGFQYGAEVTGDGAGGVVVVWFDERTTGLGSGIYAQRYDSTGVAQWPADGLRVSDIQPLITPPFAGLEIVSDGSGGAIIAWEDYTATIWANRVRGDGYLPWSYYGVTMVANPGGGEYNCAAVADGAGGVVVTWSYGGINDDILAQRLDASGNRLWGSAGVYVMGPDGDTQEFPRIAPTSGGGAIVIWHDANGSGNELRAQRLDGNGVKQWLSSGLIVSSPGIDVAEASARLTADGSDGAFITWMDSRNESQAADLIAVHLFDSGWVGSQYQLSENASRVEDPDIVSDGAGGAFVTWRLHDMIYGPAVDQVRVQWLDADLNNCFVNGGKALFDNPAAQLNPQAAMVNGGQFVVIWEDWRNYPVSSDCFAWPVNGNTPTGSNVVVSPVDLTTGTTPATLTFSDITTQGMTSLTTSQSGPPVPGSFSILGNYYHLSTTASFSGTIQICIADSLVTDSSVQLAHYDGSNWVPITTYVDTANHTICGETTSLSPFAIGTGQITSAAGERSAGFALHANVPNPFNPVTTISYDIPAGGADVSIVIYDATGRRVRELVNQHHGAGTWSAQWNGDDDRGRRVASGVYFYRMRAGAFVETRKMVLLK